MLSSAPAPPGVRCWSASLPGEPPYGRIVLSLLLEEPDSTDDVDTAFIAEVVARLPEHLATADAATRRAVATDPARFGLPEAAGAAAGPRLAAPELSFGPGREWAVRFTETDLPACRELGVAVFFDEAGTAQVDELCDAEQSG